jgi:hypothetical protein
MTVIPFRPRQRLTPPVAPPSAHGFHGQRPAHTDAYDAVSDRLRMEQNLGALIAVVLIVTLGAWLIDRLAAYSRTMACIDAGHRNCVPLDIQQPRPW